MSDELQEKQDKQRIRLTKAQWGEARAMWATGEFTLEQISERFSGIAPETLSRRFKKDGVKKGEAQVARHIEEQVKEQAGRNAAKWNERAEQAKESFYKSLELIRGLTVKVVAEANRDGKLFSAQADLKSLQMAASVLDKTRNNQWAVLGLDKEGLEDDDIPDLLVKTLTEDDIATIQRMQQGTPTEDTIEIGDADQYLDDDDAEELDDLVIEDGDDGDD